MHKILSRELENHIQKKKDYGVEGQEYANLREELNKRVGVTLTNFLYNRWED